MIKSRGYLALQLQPVIERRKVLLTPAAGLVIAALAIIFNEVTGKGTDEVPFLRRERPGPLIQQAVTWSAGALVLLVICKSLPR